MSSWSRFVRLPLLSGFFGILVVWTVVGGFINPPQDPPCAVNPRTHQPFNQGQVPPLLFIAAALVGATAGRLLSRPSFEPIRGQHAHLIVGAGPTASVSPASTASPETLAHDAQGRRRTSKGVRAAAQEAREVLSVVWVQFAVWILMLLAVIALSYETWGVANGNNPWPITLLIRCINNRASIPTLLTTLAVFFVIGSWFLFRDDEAESRGRG